MIYKESVRTRMVLVNFNSNRMETYINFFNKEDKGLRIKEEEKVLT